MDERLYSVTGNLLREPLDGRPTFGFLGQNTEEHFAVDEGMLPMADHSLRSKKGMCDSFLI